MGVKTALGIAVMLLLLAAQPAFAQSSNDPFSSVFSSFFGFLRLFGINFGGEGASGGNAAAASPVAENKNDFSSAEFFSKYGPKSEFLPVALPGGGAVPNPQVYAQYPSKMPTYIYRAALACKNDAVMSRKRIDTENKYRNFICGSRKQAQCYDDGTFDTYFVEYCEYDVPRDGVKPYSKQGNSEFGACIKVDGSNKYSNCFEYCVSLGKACQNYGCVHPIEKGSRFGEVLYENGACEGAPAKNFQCGDPFRGGWAEGQAPYQVNSVKCCCT